MTKNQRRDLYYAAMFEIVAFGLEDVGICWALAKVCEDIDPSTDIMACNALDYFYEIEKQRPIDSFDQEYFFQPGTHINERLECLSKAIDLCEKR